MSPCCLLVLPFSFEYTDFSLYSFSTHLGLPQGTPGPTVLALSETILRKSKCEFGCDSGKMSGVSRRGAKEEVTLVSPEVRQCTVRCYISPILISPPLLQISQIVNLAI